MPNYPVGHRYSEEFKRITIHKVVVEKKPPKEIADELDIRVSLLCDWIAKPLIKALETAENEIATLRKELAESPSERLQRLETENETLKGQVETLKKTVAIFSTR